MEYANLYNGVKMPMVGLGVMLTYGDECENMVREALDVGYRLFDTAKAYENEAAVGKAIAESGIAREDVFITSKIWITDAGYEKAKAAIEDSFKKLRPTISTSSSSICLPGIILALTAHFRSTIKKAVFAQ